MSCPRSCPCRYGDEGRKGAVTISTTIELRSVHEVRGRRAGFEVRLRGGVGDVIGSAVVVVAMPMKWGPFPGRLGRRVDDVVVAVSR